jgi:hypothetical protein
VGTLPLIKKSFTLKSERGTLFDSELGFSSSQNVVLSAR